MNFFKKLAETSIFQKVVQIANTQFIQKIRTKPQQQQSKNQEPQIIGQDATLPRKKLKQFFLNSQQDVNFTYEEAEQFILVLSQNSKSVKRRQNQKRIKKQVFAQLQVEPIYLQECNRANIFKMEIQLCDMGTYQRTQILHDYLNQINDTIKKVLFSQKQSVLDIFQIIDLKLLGVSEVLTKIKILRQKINIKAVSKAIKIKKITNGKMIIKQKLSLLYKMKQKQQITVAKPQNLQQVYYSQRSRHKLYLKMKNTKSLQNSNSYFKVVRNQIVSISESNAQIISDTFRKWINGFQILKDKQIEKLFICLYFIKNQPIYQENSIDIRFDDLDKKVLVQQIQKVKLWKNYHYIRQAAMKAKIIDFLNHIIGQIRVKS